MSETLPLAHVKSKFSEMVDRVEHTHDRIIVTRNGRPAAVLISPEELESLEDTLEFVGVHAASRVGDRDMHPRTTPLGGDGDVTETHVKWQAKKGVPKSPSILLIGEEIYMVDDGGVGTCLNALTGELNWKERIGGNHSASPTFANGLIYFQNETGETTVIEPGTTYKEVAKNKLGDGKTRTFASFAFVDEAILLRSESHLYRIEKQ